MTRRRSRFAIGCVLWLAACASTTDEVGGLAGQSPLDRAVLVTGGAFFSGSVEADGTFAAAATTAGGDPAREEALPFPAIVDVLQRGAVFREVVADAGLAHRHRVRDLLLRSTADPELAGFLRDARAGGFDLVLLVEELQDGPIENQGTNGRWPVTFATWILLGVGALIPDRTFESRATLRVSLRDVQTGRILHELLLLAGPIELSLVERTDFVGLLQSVIVPPFWVRDDREAVRAAVRETTQRRLLLSLARDLKSQVVRRRLDERAAARIDLVGGAADPRVVVDARESLSTARLSGRGGSVEPDAADDFAAALLASQTRVGERFHYEAPLPRIAAGGLVQVLVGTLSGGVASATFAPEAGR